MKLLKNILLGLSLSVISLNSWSANWVVIKKQGERNQPLIQVDIDSMRKTPAGNTQANVLLNYTSPKDFFNLENPVQMVSLDLLLTCWSKTPTIKKMQVHLLKNKKDKLATLDAQAEKLTFLDEAQTKEIVEGTCLISRYSIKRKQN